MKKYILTCLLRLLHFIAIVVLGSIFIQLMNKTVYEIALFYFGFDINEIVYAILYATGVISVYLSILCRNLNDTCKNE